MQSRSTRQAVRRWSGFLAVAVLCAASGVAQKAPDVRVDTAAPRSFSSEPDVAASGFAAYVTWADDRDGSFDIYFNRSLDGGASWLLSDVRLDTDAPGTVASRTPRIAAVGPLVHVVWSDERGGSTVYYNRSLDGGSTWLRADLRIDTGAGQVSSIPSIAVAGTSVYVIWEDDRSGSSSVHFNRSLNAGAPGSWLAADVRLDGGRNPQLAASGAAVYAAWERAGIWSNRSLDRGATWLPSSVRVDSGPGPSDPLPRIAASGSSVYVAWADNRVNHHDIYCNRSLDAGAAWLPADVRLNTNPAGQSISYLQEIAVSGSAVYVTWQDDRSGRAVPPFYRSTHDVYFNRSLDRGGTWLASDVRLDTDPPGASQSSHPAIAASGSAVYVTWADGRNGYGPSPPCDIYLNRSMDQGTTWLGADMRLDTDPAGSATSIMPEIAASGSSVYAVWRDHRASTLNGDIYVNIPFGFQRYGAGTAGSGGIVPELDGIGYCTLGSAASIVAWNGVGGAAGFMLVGVGQRSKVSLPLFGGTLLVLPDLVVPFGLGGAAGSPGVGSGSLALVIPVDPSLVGASLAFQALFVDLGAPAGLSMTNSVEMWIG